jgi:hypothetical protein
VNLATGFHVLLIPAILEPDNEHARVARGGNGGLNLLNHRRGGGDIKPCEVEIPPFVA